LGGVVVGKWIARGLGNLAEERVAILAATLLIAGTQIFFTSFLLSLLSLRRPASQVRSQFRSANVQRRFAANMDSVTGGIAARYAQTFPVPAARTNSSTSRLVESAPAA
jgi:hypothetical protein